MTFLFYLGHPAHYHLFKNTIKILKEKGHIIYVLIKKKDVLETLLKLDMVEYCNILPEGRKDTKFGIFKGILKRDIRLWKFCRKKSINLLIGTSVENSHIGRILKIPVLNVNEDDYDAVPLYSIFSYPGSTYILAPEVCTVGRWRSKKISYKGYHELAYLHPKYFTPNKAIVEKYISNKYPLFIIRFAKLSAHHDNNIKGITAQVAEGIINLLKDKGNICISSERELEERFQKYRIKINPVDMHHILAFTKLYIGDSQTMAAEAAILGTPFIRYNDFVGRLGYLNELENTYNLGFGIKPGDTYELFEKVESLVNYTNLENEWQKRRKKMLSEKIDVTAFMVWLIENYPNSIKIIKDKPEETQSKFMVQDM